MSKKLLLLALVLLLLLTFGIPLFAGGEKEKEVVKIRVWLYEYDEKMQADFQALFDEYNSENPNVNVTFEIPPYDTYNEKLKVGFAAGDAPEVFTVYSPWILGFSEYLDDWNEVLPSDFGDKFLNRVYEECAVLPGKQLGIPVAFATRALFVNPGYFEKAGISKYPATWDEMYQACKQLKRSLPDVIPYVIQGKGGDQEAISGQYWPYIKGNGSFLVDEDGKLVIGKSTNREKNIEAMAFLVNLVNEGLTQSNVVTTDFMDIADLFSTGKAAMTLHGSFAMDWAREKGTPFKVLPIPYNTDPIQFGYVDALCLYKGAKNRDEIAKMMVWMYGHEKRKQFSINHGMCPVLESVAKESYFADDPNWKVFTEQQNAKFHPTSKDWDRYIDEGMKQIQAVYIGDKTPTEAIDDWQKMEP